MEEDEFRAKIDHIVARDFYPDLLDTADTSTSLDEFLSANTSLDNQRFRQLMDTERGQRADKHDKMFGKGSRSNPRLLEPPSSSSVRRSAVASIGGNGGIVYRNTRFPPGYLEKYDNIGSDSGSGSGSEEEEEQEEQDKAAQAVAYRIPPVSARERAGQKASASTRKTKAASSKTASDRQLLLSPAAQRLLNKSTSSSFRNIYGSPYTQ